MYRKESHFCHNFSLESNKQNQHTYYVDEKTLMISLFDNSEKLGQILFEFSQQIVEGYEFVLANVC